MTRTQVARQLGVADEKAGKPYRNFRAVAAHCTQIVPGRLAFRENADLHAAYCAARAQEQDRS